jgi:hypothetical protein
LKINLFFVVCLLLNLYICGDFVTQLLILNFVLMQSNQNFSVYVLLGDVRRDAAVGRASDIISVAPYSSEFRALSSDAVYWSFDLDSVVSYCCELCAGVGSFRYSLLYV